MKPRIKVPAFALASFACMAMSGCSSDSKEFVPVSGTITLDGKPVPGAIVSFQPIKSGEGSPGPGSSGRCDETGRFELKAITDDPGAVVATHRIRIFSPQDEVPDNQDAVRRKSRELFPRQYNYASSLTFTVEPGGSDQANFEATTSGT